MPKWLFYLIVAIIVVVAAFFIVSLVMASFHKVGIVEEWQSWFNAIKPVGDAAKEVAANTIN